MNTHRSGNRWPHRLGRPGADDPRPYQGPRSSGGPTDHERAHGLHLSQLPRHFAMATGAAPARSALTLRLVLAVFGLAFFLATALAFWYLGLPTWLVVVAAAFAVLAAVDLIIVARRKHREP